MTNSSYLERREKLELYFDRTAVKAWERLTSDAPVSRVRQSVRAGRDAMRNQLLSWLPDDLNGKRILDAGCGTGALAIAAAERGAQVTAIDISASLIDVAEKRTPAGLASRIDYQVGDMLSAPVSTFDHVLSMDSLIHYSEQDLKAAISDLLCCLTPNRSTMLFTVAPRTRLLMLMKNAGQLFPGSDRSPAIEPISVPSLRDAIRHDESPSGTTVGRDRRINTFFYKSHALELTKQ